MKVVSGYYYELFNPFKGEQEICYVVMGIIADHGYITISRDDSHGNITNYSCIWGENIEIINTEAKAIAFVKNILKELK